MTGLEGEAASFGQAFGAAHVLKLSRLSRRTAACVSRWSVTSANFLLSCMRSALSMLIMRLKRLRLQPLALSHRKVVRALEALTPPPGRMQIFESDGMPLGVVDFGHTPDALEKAIECLIPNARARGGLWTVFGCGGDRDAGKRPIMGEIAAAFRSSHRYE